LSQVAVPLRQPRSSSRKSQTPVLISGALLNIVMEKIACNQCECERTGRSLGQM